MNKAEFNCIIAWCVRIHLIWIVNVAYCCFCLVKTKTKNSFNRQALKIVTDFPFSKTSSTLHTVQKQVKTSNCSEISSKAITICSRYFHFQLFSVFCKSCPGHTRRLALTRKARERRVCSQTPGMQSLKLFYTHFLENTVFIQDFTENENPEEKAQRHKEQEVSSFLCCDLDQLKDCLSSVFWLYLLFKAKTSV